MERLEGPSTKIYIYIYISKSFYESSEPDQKGSLKRKNQ